MGGCVCYCVGVVFVIVWGLCFLLCVGYVCYCVGGCICNCLESCVCNSVGVVLVIVWVLCL